MLTAHLQGYQPELAPVGLECVSKGLHLTEFVAFFQSLHTTVLPLGAERLFPLEVQIRTADMHRLAEYGIAGAVPVLRLLF